MSLKKDFLHPGAIAALEEMNFNKKEISYIVAIAARYNYLSKNKRKNDFIIHEMNSLDYVMQRIAGIECRLLLREDKL